MSQITKRSLLTFISFSFCTLFGAMLLLAAPRLMTNFLPATSPGGYGAGQNVPQPVAQFTEKTDSSLFRPRQSDLPPSPGPGAEAHRLTFGGAARQWWGFSGAKEGGAAPVILLLHGSGRTGRDMIAGWQEVARREGLVLIAPDSASPQGWSGESDGKDFLNAVLEAAAGTWPIDPAHVYLFGHSAGANFALTLSADPPSGVRGVAVHAGSAGPVARPAMALPIRLYVGDKDHLFPLDKVRASGKALTDAGHPTELVTIPGHDHWFYDAAPAIAADAWGWFAAK